MKFDIKKATQYLVVHGSRAYGMNTENSDVDLKGFAVAPIEYYFGSMYCGLGNSKAKFEQVESQSVIEKSFYELLNEEEKEVSKKEKMEGVVYDVRKFINLCAKMNPTMVETLFVKDSEVKFCTEVGEMVREFAPNFLSQKARWTYGGYANQQLKKMQTHRRWLLNPPTKKPEREDFDLHKLPRISKSERNALDGIVKQHKHKLNRYFGDDFCEENKDFTDDLFAFMKDFSISDNMMLTLQKEKEFESAMKDWKSFVYWQKNRNDVRFELEKKVGYDSKNASHLIRLGRSGLELLESGKMKVYRDDAEELLAIRRGQYSYEEIVQMSQELEAKSDEIYRSQKSPLPKTADMEKINQFSSDLLVKYFNLNIR
jgi:predicted nucleotidyltransferase